MFLIKRNWLKVEQSDKLIRRRLSSQKEKIVAKYLQNICKIFARKNQMYFNSGGSRLREGENISKILAKYMQN